MNPIVYLVLSLSMVAASGCGRGKKTTAEEAAAERVRRDIVGETEVAPTDPFAGGPVDLFAPTPEPEKSSESR